MKMGGNDYEPIVFVNIDAGEKIVGYRKGKGKEVRLGFSGLAEFCIE